MVFFVKARFKNKYAYNNRNKYETKLPLKWMIVLSERAPDNVYIYIFLSTSHHKIYRQNFGSISLALAYAVQLAGKNGAINKYK